MCDNRAPIPAISANDANQHRGGGGSGTHPAVYPQCHKCQLSVLHHTLPLQVERACREAGRRSPSTFSWPKEEVGATPPPIAPEAPFPSPQDSISLLCLRV